MFCGFQLGGVAGTLLKEVLPYMVTISLLLIFLAR